jgi:hypothetical protein
MKWYLYFFPLWAVLVGVVWLFREYPVEIIAIAILLAGTRILKQWADRRAGDGDADANLVKIQILKDGTVLTTFDAELDAPNLDAVRALTAHIARIMNEKAEREQADGENKN